MNRRRILLLTAASLMAASVGLAQVEESQPGEQAEKHLSTDQKFQQWSQEPAPKEGERGDKLETKQVMGEKLETVKLHNVVPAIHFESGVAKIPSDYVERLNKILASMRYRKNVRVHFVGHADSQRLSPSLAKTFGDNMGLSRERAGEVAEYFKKTLGLPPEAITYEWVGDTMPIATNGTEEGRALNRRVEVEVWYDEVKQVPKEEEVVVGEDIKRIKVCRMQTVCKMRYQEGHERRARVRNLVVPLRYEDDTTPVSDAFIQQVRQAVANLHDKQNLTVKFIGYTDDAPLSARDERIYGDALALSKARARRVALAMKEALKLPTSALDSDGHGSAQPVASNETPQGRSLNRRVEVEFWYDDPLQELPDEPQLCPSEAGEEMLTKVYDPPWGSLPEIELDNGQPIIPPGLAAQVQHALADIKDRLNPRVRFIGYTKNERLDRRTAEVYGDDIGLSAARALRTMSVVMQDPALAGTRGEVEGRGYVQSDDVVNAGFIAGERSFVRPQVVYEEPMPLDTYDGVDITRMTREVTPQSPYDLNVMRITVDGKPIDDPGLSSSDIQRCTDVALDQAKIQFHFDNLQTKPRLAVAAHPVAVAVSPDGSSAGTVHFEMYDNYASFIQRAEIRLFEKYQSLQAAPLATLPVDETGRAEWQAPADRQAAPVRELKFVLRAYDAQGHFDETEPHPLWLIREVPSADLGMTSATGSGSGNASTAGQKAADQEASEAASVFKDPKSATSAIGQPVEGGQVPTLAAGTEGAASTEASSKAPYTPAPPVPSELLAAYGESDLFRHEIPMSGGTVRVQGGGIPPGHTVWVAGKQVPVDPQGNFVAEEILPTGAHTVEVAVLDDAGNGSVYLRDLEFKKTDLFYVGMADLTYSTHSSSGPVDQLEGDNVQQPFDSSLDGRIAFFVNGKLNENWKLTASADTREGPVEDMFSNFLDKSPDALFRRFDPDYHYPTFGDDSSVEEMAPTLGKFYVKASRGESYGMWGNFKIDYVANELAQVDRGLYGANGHYASRATTSFGEHKASADAFAAEPGTMPSFEEFRGTGGSLYYLHHQDILTGSDQLRIEIRDKASQIVTGVVNLRLGIDYDIDYLQGRVLLSEPLSSTADDNLLVRTSGLSGDEAYLVARYEFTPGFGNLDLMAAGGQGHYWLGDHVRLGVTAGRNDEGDVNNNLGAADLTLRKSTDTWLKVQAGRSEGLMSSTLRSEDGGFGFTSADPLSFTDANANAYRADASLGFDGGKGHLTLYGQSRDAGYSAQGQSTLKDTDQYGGTFKMTMGSHVTLAAKGDQTTEDLGLDHRALELDMGFKLTDKWTLSTGVRDDNREDHSPVVPLTQEQGERTDAVAQLGFDPGTSWRAYGFAQDTLSSDGNREDNSRYGLGGSYRLSQRFKLDGEVSDGDLGTGAKLGTTYLVSERTNLYLNYLLENDRTDAGVPMRQGTLVTGVKQRFSDASSVYLEERYQDAGTMTGLTHATGVNLVANERWNFGASAEYGTLIDALSSAQTDRRAVGVRLGYSQESVQFTSGVEYRRDNAEQPDLTTSERTTWLFRNAFKFQLNPDWRLVGKLNHSFSNSSLGDFFNGGYTEGVLGYAYRPVKNDRLNALIKFTYFYNMPTAGQVGADNTASEFIQKSCIAAVDVNYDLTAKWGLGGKYAYRVGSVSMDRVNPTFFDNNAQLGILRLDFRFLQSWEGMGEARILDLSDLGQRKTGYLGAIYRYFGKHLKAGAGYNFTDFSDDLTDLNYDHEGFFFNIVGSM